MKNRFIKGSALIILALILASMMIYMSVSHAETLSKKQLIQEVIKETKATIAALNQNLPKRIDNYTIMEKIKPNDNGFIYTYTVSVPITKEMEKELHSNVLHMVKSNWCAQTWFNNSIYQPIVSFIYNGTKNTQSTFIINKYDCN
ncbi:hypothetical protein [Xenorhabdus sp. KK7.4]|uniref:hypothetical protein n=1 Tax=Xenorhabdus sp. KK7.4 TaxID=1851572 RepID=UPI000C042480|nr:hypothetical protein [Xenorhabdus sp. KK7.4]PHM52116.1 hypothetical protein Xekk_03341 [Xenorhabdus sp. KK7.4]